MNHWFDLHLPAEKARTMNREGYYAARSWLRRVRHILHLRYAAAYIDPKEPNVVHFPDVASILPEKFK